MRYHPIDNLKTQILAISSHRVAESERGRARRANAGRYCRLRLLELKAQLDAADRSGDRAKAQNSLKKRDYAAGAKLAEEEVDLSRKAYGNRTQETKEQKPLWGQHPTANLVLAAGTARANH